MKRLTLLLPLLLVLSATAAQAQNKDNESIVRDFISAWSRLNPSELASYFSEEGVYQNMPNEAVIGRSDI